jgi:PTH1 family peptidyl-tRNA hydrolase
MWLVVGLGNPGMEYADTRHNIGFMVADELHRRWRMDAFKSKFGCELSLKGEMVVLKPQEYMNLSGPPTQRAAAFYKIAPTQTIVVHDEIDLPFGKLRVKAGGGHGGHNGLRSLIEQLGADFLRVRCGVDKPTQKERVTGHVLGGFSKSERQELPHLVGGAADAVELIINKGVTLAMNQINADREQPRS